MSKRGNYDRRVIRCVVDGILTKNLIRLGAIGVIRCRHRSLLTLLTYSEDIHYEMHPPQALHFPDFP